MKLTFSAVKHVATRVRLAELACAAAIVSIGLTVAFEHAALPAIRAYDVAAQGHQAFEDAMTVQEGPARSAIVTRNGGKLAGDLYESWVDDVEKAGDLLDHAAGYKRARDVAYGVTALLLVLWLVRRMCRSKGDAATGSTNHAIGHTLYMRFMDGQYANPKVIVDGHELSQRAVVVLAVAMDNYVQDLKKVAATPTNADLWVRARAIRTLLVREWGGTEAEAGSVGDVIASGDEPAPPER